MSAVALAPVQPTQVEVVARLEDLRVSLSRPDLQLGEMIDIRSRAELLRSFIRTARLSQHVADQAAELQLRAERRCGAILIELAEQASPPKRRRTRAGMSVHSPRALPRRTLIELGIRAKDSSNWQAIARLPTNEFEARLQARREAGRPISSTSLIRAAKQFVRTVSGRPSTPAARTLSHALRLLKTIRAVRTPAEADLARQVVKLAQAWAVALEPPAAVTPTAWERQVCCLLCGRPQPPSNPPRCPACDGPWYCA